MLMTLVCAISAQGGGVGAADGSDWQFPDGTTAHLDVTDNPAGGVWCTTTMASGFSGAVDGTQGDDAANGAVTCTNSKTMVNGSGDQTRVMSGKLYKRGADGKWKRGMRIPKIKRLKAAWMFLGDH